MLSEPEAISPPGVRERPGMLGSAGAADSMVKDGFDQDPLLSLPSLRLVLAAYFGSLKDPHEMKEANLKSGSSCVLNQHLRSIMFFRGHK